MGISVRKFTLGDVDRMIDLGEMMHNEGPYRRFGYDRGKLQMLAKHVALSESFFCIAAEEDGEVIGMHLSQRTEMLFSDEVITHELITYVIPEKRGTTAFVRLVNAYVNWAKSIHAKRILLGASAMDDNSRTYDLYERLGFVECGRTYELAREHV